MKHGKCAIIYDRFSRLIRTNKSPVHIYGNNICATRPDKLGDVCQGDSGGSLLYRREDGRFEVIGVVSYGFGCGSEFEGEIVIDGSMIYFIVFFLIPGEALPAIFGRVSSVIKWISRETRDGGFCRSLPISDLLSN